MIWVGLVVVNSPIIFMLGRVIFGDAQGFIDALVFWIKPDLWSWVEGELFEDWWQSFKLWVFVAICFGALTTEYALITQYFHIAPK